MASISVNGIPRALWTDAETRIAGRVAERVLEGCGLRDSDRTKNGIITRIVRRQCNDAERRRVVEKYLR